MGLMQSYKYDDIEQKWLELGSMTKKYCLFI